MNPVFRMAAENTDGGPLLAFMTVFFMLFFFGWVWYAYRPANKEKMAAWGRLPLEDDSPSPKGGI